MLVKGNKNKALELKDLVKSQELWQKIDAIMVKLQVDPNLADSGSIEVAELDEDEKMVEDVPMEIDGEPAKKR